MKLFDILDRHGNPTGKTAERGHPCADNEYYLGVYICNADGAFLLQKRADCIARL